MTFYYENGVMATAQSSILCHSDRMGAVWGTDGYLTCENINNVASIDVHDAIIRSRPIMMFRHS